MTRDRIISYVGQLASLVAKVHEGRQVEFEAQAMREYLTDTGRASEALKLSSQLNDVRAQVGELEEAVCRKAKVESFDAAETLLVDIRSALNLAEEHFGKWRAMLAVHEVAVRTGEYATPEARAEAEERLSKARKTYEVALEAAGDKVPSAGVVLL